MIEVEAASDGPRTKRTYRLKYPETFIRINVVSAKDGTVYGFVDKPGAQTVRDAEADVMRDLCCEEQLGFFAMGADSVYTSCVSPGGATKLRVAGALEIAPGPHDFTLRPVRALVRDKRIALRWALDDVSHALPGDKKGGFCKSDRAETSDQSDQSDQAGDVAEMAATVQDAIDRLAELKERFLDDPYDEATRARVAAVCVMTL